MVDVDLNWPRWNNFVSVPKFQPFWFEKVDVDWVYAHLESYLVLTLCVGVPTLYMGGIWSLQRFMRDRKPFELRGVIALWNLLVTAFSLTVLVRLGTEIVITLQEPQGFYTSMCLREGFHVSSAFWIISTCMSKPFLLLDTVFLTLRKKSIDPMHAIHHALSVMLSAQLTFFAEPASRWMILANLSAHSIAYPLLALMALQIRVPKAKQTMAVLEGLQLIFMLFLTGYTSVVRASGGYCVRHPQSIAWTYGVVLVILAFLLYKVLSSSSSSHTSRSKGGRSTVVPEMIPEKKTT